MKRVLFSMFLFVTAFAHAQIAGKKSEDPIIIMGDFTVKPGDTLHFGSGSDLRGEFVYIYQPPNGWAGTRGGGLPRNYARKYAVVKHFKTQKDKRTGEKTVAVINVAGGLNQVADIEDAIQSKEIIAINQHSFLKEDKPTVVVQTGAVSKADELKKLKALLDDGTLTKEEYEVEKKKLLEKN